MRQCPGDDREDAEGGDDSAACSAVRQRRPAIGGHSAQFGHSQRVVDVLMRRFIAAGESICPNWVQLSVTGGGSAWRRDASSDQLTAGGFRDPRSTGTSYSSART